MENRPRKLCTRIGIEIKCTSLKVDIYEEVEQQEEEEKKKCILRKYIFRIIQAGGKKPRDIILAGQGIF